MPQSQQYKELKKAITKLNRILPKAKVAGDYTFLEQVKVKSYRLLCHAEVEYFIEEVCRNSIEKVFLDWRQSKKNEKAYVLVHFFAILGWNNEKTISRDTTSRLGALVNDYKTALTKNHGIKESNLNSMLMPLGIDLDQYTTLVNDLNTFGSDRGSIAHTAMTTHQILDPISEKNRVKQIVISLKDLDADLHELMK